METKKIKVLFVINDFTVAGAQRLYLDLLRHLDRGRFAPSLLSLFELAGRETWYDELPPDVPVTRLAFKSFRDLSSWRKLFAVLMKKKSDLVLSSLFFSNTVIRILKPFFRYRVITMEHNTYTLATKRRSQILVDRLLAPLSRVIIAVSNTVGEFTARQQHLPRTKFRVIHNGIDIERIQREKSIYQKNTRLKEELGFTPDERIVINAARLTAQKNQLPLVEAFADFSRAHPEYRLIILGEGTWRGCLEERIRALRAEGSISLLGARQNIVPYYLISDFFVSPSLIEGFGIAHAEALALGVPVLSTKTAGPDEMIIEGVNGFFIQEPMKESILAGLEKMAATDLTQFRVAAPATVEQFDIRKVVREYEHLFIQCLRN